MCIETNRSVIADRNFRSAWWTPRLAGPFIAAAVVRLGLLAVSLTQFGISALCRADTSSYLIPGRNLLLHGRFFADGVPDLLRTPGYPLYLAMTSLAGLPAAAVATSILSVFSVILVWRLGRKVFGDDRIALGAAWLFAFEPLSVAFSFALVSETLFLTLFLLSMDRLAEFLLGRSLPMLAEAGLWLTAATFVRPVTYYLPVALAIGLYVVLARLPGLRWKAPAVMLISVLPWLATWQIRNWVETGYGGFSSTPDSNLYFIAAANVTAHLDHRSPSAVISGLGYPDFTNNSGQAYLFPPYLALHPEQTGWSQAQRLAFMHSAAVPVIRAHPAVYLHVCLSDLLKTLFYPGVYYEEPARQHQLPTRYEGEGPARWLFLLTKFITQQGSWVMAEKAAFEVVLLGLYLFTARGVFLTARGTFHGRLHNACLWLLLGVSLYFLAVSVASPLGPLATPRFRLPVMPVVCILAAAGWQRTKSIVRKGCAGMAGEISPG